MIGKFSDHLDDMAVALVLWMCSLPLVLLLVLPFFGLKLAALAALVLLVLALAVCWGACSWKLFRS